MPQKKQSAFMPPALIKRAQANIGKYEWAKKWRDQILAAAKPWMAMSDEKLWSLMFGPSIKRSWMVWSNGHCPACKKSVPMYNWKIDAIKRPWKVACPHCNSLFPRNDFHAFYKSGLNKRGIFDPKLANRTLLVGAGGPDRKFGVDDGEGYVAGGKRWRFIGAYLIYGQWKQVIVAGVEKLAAAYAVTGDVVYARKAGILLDRVADLYPQFDFKKQGILYEGPGAAGYVSTWHDACEETRMLALGYDYVFDGMKSDPALMEFLSKKAQTHGLANQKKTFQDIQRNIEKGILIDAARNKAKIHSNFPRTKIALAIINTVLAWPRNRDGVIRALGQIAAASTKVDGVTGEKGLANYSAFGPQSMALFLAEYDRLDPTILDQVLKSCPRLHSMYRFHIDTWCLGKYYPFSGDSGWFAGRKDEYQGVRTRIPAKAFLFSHKDPPLAPSMFTFLYRLSELTGDNAFLQIMAHGNKGEVKGLPYDLFAKKPEAVQEKVSTAIKELGTVPNVKSVNKQQWHLAILRSGKGKDARALWLDYDSGGKHSHMDGMNLGLFAKGLDLLPEFGYPPVQFGGWGSANANWYKATAAHITVVVDGRNQKGGVGKTTLWTEGDAFRAMRFSSPGMGVGTSRFERTAALIDISDKDAYVLDVFRVKGGRQHTKTFHSHFGRMTPKGLRTAPVKKGPVPGIMRNFRRDAQPKPGWEVDWRIEDRYGYLKRRADVHLRYIDLTPNVQAFLCEGWIVEGGFDKSTTTWIPRLLVQRQAKQNLASTFVSVIEPYERRSNLKKVERLDLKSASGRSLTDSHIAVQVTLHDGRRDLLVMMDPQGTAGRDKPVAQPETEVQFRGDALFVRWSANGKVQRLGVAACTEVRVGDVTLTLNAGASYTEISLEGNKASVRSGESANIKSIRIGNSPLPLSD